MAQQHKVGTTATAVQHARGLIRVIYHSTAVVEATDSADGVQIRLDSGGWRTNTTKTRMNQASNEYDLGYQVYAKDRVWYVDYKGTTRPFVDGMVL